MPDKEKLKKLEQARKDHLATVRDFKTDAESKAWYAKRAALDNALIKEKKKLGIPLSKTSSGKAFETKTAAAIDYNQAMSNKTIDRFNNKK